jgi:hypothetical protein
MSDSDKSSFPVSVSCPSPSASSFKEIDGADYWEYHLERWRQSGLSQTEYCRRHNLNYKRFHSWKTRLKSYPTGRSVKLVEVKHDFTLTAASPSCSGSIGGGGLCGDGNVLSPPGTQYSALGSRLPGVRSGIRFWLGEFCIEVDVPFSSQCLSQLIGTLRELQTVSVGELETGGNDSGGSGGSGGVDENV